MRHVVAILSTSAVLMGSAVSAAPFIPAFSHQRAELFAKCSGRLAALASHQRSIRHAGAPQSQRLREEFDVLLEAVLPDALDDGVPDYQAELWRSRGWAEIAGFLADAHYSFDSDIAAAAEDAAVRRIAECRDVILPTT